MTHYAVCWKRIQNKKKKEKFGDWTEKADIITKAELQAEKADIITKAELQAADEV